MAKQFAYCRVSTTDQNLEVQIEALRNYGVNDALIFSEQVSGTSRDGRAELARVLALLQKGDTLVVTRLDRLGRSLKDLADIAHELEKVGAHLKVIEQSVDTSTAAGRAFFGMLATFAQFESDIRRERQIEGVARAKRNGEMSQKTGLLKYAGRPPKIDGARVRELHAGGTGPAAIARELKISQASVYRLLKEHARPIHDVERTFCAQREHDRV